MSTFEAATTDGIPRSLFLEDSEGDCSLDFGFWSARLARWAVRSDDEVRLVARELFLETGPVATTAEVARRAGVAEGTLLAYSARTR